MRKDEAQLDFWLKTVAPSPALRKWFAHDPAKWEELQLRYVLELQRNPAVKELQDMIADEKATLLYAARDPRLNHALVLFSYFKNIPE